MSCISQTYNCSITWMIENFKVFLNQGDFLDSFCTPEAEVETLNHGKWTLTLKKPSGYLKFFMRKALTNSSLQLEASVDFRVSFVGTDGSLYFSKIASGVKFGDAPTEIGNFLFKMDELLELRKLLFPKGMANLRVELRFCDSNPLILCSTIRTKMKMERFSFTCSAEKFHEFLLGEIPSFPIDALLERSPNFNLQFQSSQLLIHKRSGYPDRRLVADQDNTSEDCDVLLHVNISLMNSHTNIKWISKWLFFNSSKIDDKRILTNPYENFLDLKQSSDLDLELELSNLRLRREFGNADVECKFSFADGKYGTLLEQRDYSHPYCSTQTSDVVKNKSYLGQLLFKEQKFVDVTLKAGTESFKAHKAVLSSASPVFSAMFDHEMKERESGVVCIEDLEPDTVKRMLRFMYTDTIDCDANFEDIASLFAAADKYEIYSLKGHCSSRLISMLSADNVCRVLHLAYMHDDKEMQQASKETIISDPSKVLDSEEWKKFMENCIRGRAAKSSVSSFFNQHQLRKSVSNLRRRISKISLSRG